MLPVLQSMRNKQPWRNIRLFLTHFASRKTQRLRLKPPPKKCRTTACLTKAWSSLRRERKRCSSVTPVIYAKHLCEQADLTREQRGPVALLAKDIKKVYIKEVERRAQLTEAPRRSEGLDATGIVRLPLVGR